MTVTPPHGWLLTAPWWYWPRQDAAPRDTVPALQKYATAELVDEFLADPQRRLVFDDRADLTEPSPYDPATLLPVTVAEGKLTKLYLATHHRHYLVAAELHCDELGLPSPDRSDVCEAGFVIRRRRSPISHDRAKDARRRIRAVSVATARLGVLERRLRQAAAAGRIGQARFTALAEQRDLALKALQGRQSALTAWAAEAGVERELEGWFPLAVDGSGQVVPLPERPCKSLRPLPRIGRWSPVGEVTGEIHESVFPLYPLVPDPRDPGHDAAGRTIWFGVVPTATLDVELLPPEKKPKEGYVDRGPRFDDLSAYEIRCFVRRHDPACPRKPGERDCHGPLTWSEPTAPYRLAGQLDPRGTANRPVTVRLPSKAELKEGAKLGPGMGGIRIGSPDINLDVGSDGFQICSFGIPLITIVATFVLKIFLGIVVFLFGLWILLAFRLCIPPSIKIDADAQAFLAAKGPDFTADVDFEIELAKKPHEVDTKDTLRKSGESMDNGAKAALAPDPKSDLAAELQNEVPVDERFHLLRSLVINRLTAPEDDLRYEPRVERAEVFVP